MGTRGSPLAMAQSRQFAAVLEAAHPSLQVVEKIIRTTGDSQQASPLPAIGGKGLFTLEIEAALLKGEIDFAIHSLKDLPPELPEGLYIAVVPERACAADVLVFNRNLEVDLLEGFANLPECARIGTSSLRRSAQLAHFRPDLRIESVRGNIDTRLRKLESEDFDAIVLAAAGLGRLWGELADFELEECCLELDEEGFVPAPGQGALAIEARLDDKASLELLAVLEHASARAEITVERTVMKALGAGCSTPLGARAVVQGNRLRAWAVVLSHDGTERIAAEASGLADAAQAIGETVAARLIEQGARRLMGVAEVAKS